MADVFWPILGFCIFVIIILLTLLDYSGKTEQDMRNELKRRHDDK